jgi:hypothetical protein
MPWKGWYRLGAASRTSKSADKRRWLLSYFVDLDAVIDHLVDLDVVLSLIDEEGNPSAGQLSIRVTQDSTAAIAGDAVEEAQARTRSMTQPPVADAAKALTAISDTVSNQQNLITSFDALVNKLGVLVKIGDEVAKVWFSIPSRSMHNSK